MLDLWPHQSAGLDSLLAAITEGKRRLCLTSPTGGGKSVMIVELIRRLVAEEWKAVFYSNRRLLVEQLRRVLVMGDVKVGVRAAGHEPALSRAVQISSLQTEQSWAKEGKLPHGEETERCIAIVDECHMNKTGAAEEIQNWHWSRGHVILGVTATPIDLAHLYQTLIVAGTNSELRKCGALVPCYHYGPDEPDIKAHKLRNVQEGDELSESQQRKVMMVRGIFGRVIASYRQLNPEQRPTILFGPGVRESLWFAEQFCKEGIKAAHIDGQEVWIDGTVHRRTHDQDDPVNAVFERAKAGDIKVVCNRFVLREGVDLPFMAHAIFACVFGSLSTYLQAGGRLLRSHPGLESVTVQDHGGHWHRHGSLNADRVWNLGRTNNMLAGLRSDRLRANPKECPYRCECGLIVAQMVPKDGMNLMCPKCGRTIDTQTRSRPVVQTDGALKPMLGDIYKKRRVSTDPRGPKRWEQMYWRSRTVKGARTFRAAAALFATENKWAWPDPRWPFMPTRADDWFRLVADVPRERLTGQGVEHANR